MKKSKPFKFKQFEIIQELNPQKVGTDSMLLGAWSKGEFKRILDIGTGTGILALMLAQQNKKATITAIEPNIDSLNEASKNFKNSIFSSQILPIHSPLQYFGSMDKFDMIICNPPYYNGTYLSNNADRNQARHTNELAIHELYQNVSDLLSEDGLFNVIVPFEIEKEHIERAFDNGLFIQKILHTIKEDGTKKRSLISFGFGDIEPIQSELLVKDSSNNYSKEYIELTKEFYLKTL